MIHEAINLWWSTLSIESMRKVTKCIKNMNLLVLPKDEAYKRNSWLYMSAAYELTLTLLKDRPCSCLLYKCDAEEEGVRAWYLFHMCLKWGKYINQWWLCEDDDPTRIHENNLLWDCLPSFFSCLQWPLFIGFFQVISIQASHVKEGKVPLMEMSLHLWKVKEASQGKRSRPTRLASKYLNPFIH